jgi:hypothetical protein
MYSTLSVDGTDTQYLDDDAHVTLDFGYDTTTHRCAACGEDLVETGEGFASDESGLACSAEDDDETGQHQPERMPLSWINSAGIVTSETDDSVTLLFSVGDPRGAFAVTVRRIPDDAEPNLAGRLLVHLPHPGETMPHRPLTELHPGTFVVG